MEIPDYKVIMFRLSHSTLYYETMTAPPGFTKIPFDLKIEETRERQKIDSDLLIHGRIKNGKYQFFTGLRHTPFDYWYYGDHYDYTQGKKKNSFILFNLTPDNQLLTIYFFNNWNPYPAKRDSFIHSFVEHLENGK